ncbi:Zinc finger CCCH domain-containing protein 10 [Trichostrongylus colubriformis]|uniref:Zinc finger CCCH domain-containing protein 10 n=1 Tax=Trichostrongylus colubriformis TaxID=6319 RepID=A0AAN8ISS9_TRICO
MSDEQCDPKKEVVSGSEAKSDANGDRSESPSAGGGGGGSSGNNENGAGRDRDDVCRDFLKNICNRGSRCKFFHPTDSKQRTEDMINFCIDFQNRGCMRDNCRFVHASREEVERYKHTREVTLPLARAIAAVSQGDTIAGIPVCKEFQSGKCARGAQRCRYWHVNVEEERERRLRGLPPSGGPLGRFGGPGGRYGGGPMYGVPPLGMRRSGPPLDGPYEKRSRMEEGRVTELERKNAELSKEVETLKRELQREHERYEDLYALFRQQSGGAAAAPAKSATQPGYGAVGGYGNWNAGGAWQ